MYQDDDGELNEPYIMEADNKYLYTKIKP